jgi:hypothetical protein
MGFAVAMFVLTGMVICLALGTTFITFGSLVDPLVQDITRQLTVKVP